MLSTQLKKKQSGEGLAVSNKGPSGAKIESNKLYKANHFVIPNE